MTVDEALSGKVAKLGQRMVSGEEHDDAWKGTRIGKGLRPFAEVHHELIQPTDVSKTVQQMQGNWGSDHLAGNEHRVAAKLRDLTHAVKSASSSNEIPLYRAAMRTPLEDIGASRDTPLSFTSDRYVADHFLKKATQGRGAIFKAAPGLVRGVNLNDLGGRTVRVGPNSRPEAEWLIDPQSVPTEWPKK